MVFVDGIRAAIGGALPEVFHVDVVEPASDVELTPNQVAVKGALVPLAVHQEPPPEGFGGSL
jgi:hypothetical protein